MVRKTLAVTLVVVVAFFAGSYSQRSKTENLQKGVNVVANQNAELVACYFNKAYSRTSDMLTQCMADYSEMRGW